MHCINYAKREQEKPLLFKLTLRSRFALSKAQSPFSQAICIGYFMDGEHVRAVSASEFVLHNEWIKIVQANYLWNNVFIIYIPRFISKQNSKINISLFSLKGKQRAVKAPHSSRVALKWLPCNKNNLNLNSQAKMPLKGRTSQNKIRNPENMS